MHRGSSLLSQKCSSLKFNADKYLLHKYKKIKKRIKILIYFII